MKATACKHEWLRTMLRLLAATVITWVHVGVGGLAAAADDQSLAPVDVTTVDSAEDTHEKPVEQNQIVEIWRLGSGNREIATKLVQRLDDKSEVVRAAAIRSLGELRWQAAVVAIGDALTDDNRFVRVMAIKALGKIGGAEARDELLVRIEAEDSQDSSILVALIEALMEIGDGDDVNSAAISLARTPSASVRVSALRVLGKNRCLAAIGEMLRSLDDNDSDVRAEALSALYRTVPPAKGEWDDAPTLVKWLASPSVERKLYALARLAIIKESGTVPEVIKLLSGHESRVSALAAETLGGIGGAEAVAALMETLKTTTDSSVWSSAAVAIATCGERKAIPIIADGIVRFKGMTAKPGLAALGVMHDPETVDAIRSLPAVVRQLEPLWFLAALVRLGDEEAWKQVESIVGGAGSAQDRILVTQVLAFADEERSLDVLITLMNDKEPAIRAAAAKALGDLSKLPPRAMDALKKTTRDRERGVRCVAAAVLRESRIRFYKEQSTEIREEAPNGIGNPNGIERNPKSGEKRQ